MHFALAGSDALRVLRLLRCRGVDAARLPHADLATPDPSPYQRLRANRLDLDALALSEPPTPARPLRMSAPSRESRPHSAFAKGTIIGRDSVPDGSFLEIGNGIQIPCPELLFYEMGTSMLPAVHLALGMELCGQFSRDAREPISGQAALGVAPVTSAGRLVEYLDACHNLPGLVQARIMARKVCNDAWSPMEAAVAALLTLPFAEFGYNLAPLTLNQRVGNTSAMPGSRESRVPDILFEGTHVGFNYDGMGHLDIEGVVQAASDAAVHTEDSDADKALRLAVSDMREKYVDDRRRDRELWAQGFSVMPVTIEDLREPGGLDALVTWAIDAIEAEGDRDLSEQRASLNSPALTHQRQRITWSLLPGELGRENRRSLVDDPPATSNPRIVFSGTFEW